VIDEVTTTIATGAAGNIVAYMLSGQVDFLREQIKKMFRHGTEHERTEAIHALEGDALALAQHEVSKPDLAGRWTSLMLRYLAAHPEARSDIEALASRPASGKIVTIGSQNNYGGGAFIGGDNYGGITIRGQE
jgi:hypothetical protein